MRCICRHNTRFSRVLRNKAAKVNSPRRNRAGSTAATNGSRWVTTWARNPKAISELDTAPM
jgi:hypothetical protein